MVAAATTPVVERPAEVLGDLPASVVFFDGVCVVCNSTVDRLLRRDRAARLAFAPLQGETAERVRRALRAAMPAGLDTMVLFERTEAGPRVLLRSRAMLRALELTGGAPGLGLLRAVPAPLLDLGYRAFARLRYRLFGRRDSCRVPAPEERARFLP